MKETENYRETERGRKRGRGRDTDKESEVEYWESWLPRETGITTQERVQREKIRMI